MDHLNDEAKSDAATATHTQGVDAQALSDLQGEEVVVSTTSITLDLTTVSGTMRDSGITDVGDTAKTGGQVSVHPMDGEMQNLEERVNELKTRIEENLKALEPTLYCPVNHRSHADLVEFGILACPRCNQDLQPAKDRMKQDSQGPKRKASLPFAEITLGSPLPQQDGFAASSRTPEVESDAGSPTVESSLDGSSPVAGISYSVEFRDAVDSQIATVPWDGPFDLDDARKGVQSSERSRAAFDFITILETSLPYGSRQFRYDSNNMLDLNILENASVAVSVRSTSIVLHSLALIKALSRVVSYYPSVNLNGDIVMLEEPFSLVAHHYKELRDYMATYPGPSTETEGAGEDHQPNDAQVDRNGQAPEICDTETHQHLTLLLDFLQSAIYKDDIREEEARHARNACTFRMLWLMFKPGSTVYYESGGGRLSAYVVQSLEVDNRILSSSRRKLRPYILKIWNLDYDGRFVGRCGGVVTIPYFDGERAVTSLKAFPVEFVDREDGGKTKARLEKAGRRWYELIRGGQVYYSGKFMSGTKRQFEGRSYVDSASYFLSYPAQAATLSQIEDMGEELGKCTCEECYGQRPHPPTNFRWTKYDLLDPVTDKNLEVDVNGIDPPLHRYFICILKSRTWELLDSAHCHPPKVNLRAIDTLVMPSERKEMIKALIQKFSDPSQEETTRSWGADFIENKGEGQIFLLHGSPGVGKTYTAECIAEYTGRPLLSLTCGDIGTDEVKMEEQLQSWFRLSEKWGAVMLIDEADVYLEKRQMTDLKRNSLVSVFLRCIEYYRGILFLTTNRVGLFDDAFISRIHIIIRYENLNEDDRRKIWSQFFDKLSEEREDFMITGRAKAYVLGDENVSKMSWNGREIRNAFQTAVALAEYRFSQKPNKSKHDTPTLDQKDFEQVCDMTRQFKQYLTDVHGVDEDGRAFLSKARVSQAPH